MRFPGSGGGVDDGVRGGRRRARGRLALVAAAVLLLFGGSTLVSWYVEALWFESLGFGDVFWTTITLKTTVFWVVGGRDLHRPLRGVPPPPAPPAARPDPLRERPARHVLARAARDRGVLGRVPAGGDRERVEHDAALGDVRALPARARRRPGRLPLSDPIFGRPIPFYLFTLPVWHLRHNWLTTVALVVFLAALAAFVLSGEAGRHLFGAETGRRGLPRRLVRARVPPADARRAGVSLALRSAVRRPHHLLRRRLHRGPRRHPGAARRVGRARALGALAAIYNGLGPRRLAGLARGARTGRRRLRRAHCRCPGTSAASS